MIKIFSREESSEKVSMILYKPSPIATPFVGAFEFIFEHIFIVGPNKEACLGAVWVTPHAYMSAG